MIEGISVQQRIKFVSSNDNGEKKTEIVLRPITGLEAIETMRFFKDGKFEMTSEYVRYITRCSIVEVSNPDIKDREGINAFIETLPAVVLMQLIGEINKISKISGEEAKN
jgi:hypothetical protein